MIIISRDDAKSGGAKRYFTGLSCKRGHVAPRQVSTGMCSTCARERCKRWKSDNAERNKATAAAWRSANAEKLRIGKRQWREANIEQYAATKRVWREANRERERAGCRSWRAKNLEYDIVRVRANQAIRRSRRKLAGGSHTPSDIKAILNLQKGRCAYCQVKLLGFSYHIDHIIALARGGSNRRSNLQILCAPCNQAKGAKDPIDFAQSLGRLL